MLLVAEPVSIFINTYGSSNINLNDSQISSKVEKIFKLTPLAIINRFNLKVPFTERHHLMVIWVESPNSQNLILIIS